MKLYEIDEKILECVDQETGEIIDAEQLDYLQMERDQKIENIGLWIKDLKADADAIKNEIANLQSRKKAAENKAESLKKYLDYVLEGQKFKTPRLSVSYRKSESVQVNDVFQIDREYVKVPDPVPDKTKIKKALKDGVEINGVELVTNTSIQIK